MTIKPILALAVVASVALAGWLAPYEGFPEAVGDEVDDALLGSEECCRTSPRIGPNRKGIAHTRERASIEPRRDVRERSI